MLQHNTGLAMPQEMKTFPFGQIKFGKTYNLSVTLEPTGTELKSVSINLPFGNSSVWGAQFNWSVSDTIPQYNVSFDLRGAPGYLVFEQIFIIEEPVVVHPVATIEYESNNSITFSFNVTEILFFASVQPIDDYNATLIFQGLGCNSSPYPSLESSYLGIDATLEMVLSNPTNETIQFKVWSDHVLAGGGKKIMNGSIPPNLSLFSTFNGPTSKEVDQESIGIAQVHISLNFMNGTPALGLVGIFAYADPGYANQPYSCNSEPNLLESIWNGYGMTILVFSPMPILFIYFIRKRRKRSLEIDPYPHKESH